MLHFRRHALGRFLSSHSGFFRVSFLVVLFWSSPYVQATDEAQAAGRAPVAAAQNFYKGQQAKILQDFRDFLKLENTGDLHGLQQNADWLKVYLEQRDFKAEIWSEANAPYIFAERQVKGAGKTILFYAHFDGQPADPSKWQSDPFEPVIRTGPVEDNGFEIEWQEALTAGVDPNWRIFARSAGDDKAPIIALMSALDALEAAGIAPSVNIKIILDGEEEKGSPGLARILAAHADTLRADLLLFCDGPMHQSGRRQLVFGVRGSMSVDLTTYGPIRPLHSGHYGNWAPSPNDRLVQVLASLKNNRGEIVVPGFDKDVTPLTQAEKEAIDALPSVDEKLRRDLSLNSLDGGGDRLELLITRPALVLKGIDGGAVGDQSKNLIGTSATASLNIRLVPAQTPQEMRKTLHSHFLIRGYEIIDRDPSREDLWKFDRMLKMDWKSGAYPGYRTNMTDPAALALLSVLDTNFGQKTLKAPTMGGSLPLHVFAKYLENMPIVILPTANHDNNQHGENENLRFGNLFNAVETFAVILSEYGMVF